MPPQIRVGHLAHERSEIGLESCHLGVLDPCRAVGIQTRDAGRKRPTRLQDQPGQQTLHVRHGLEFSMPEVSQDEIDTHVLCPPNGSAAQPRAARRGRSSLVAFFAARRLLLLGGLPGIIRRVAGLSNLALRQPPVEQPTASNTLEHRADLYLHQRGHTALKAYTERGGVELVALHERQLEQRAFGARDREENAIVESDETTPIDLHREVAAQTLAAVDLENVRVLPGHGTVQFLEVLLSINGLPRHGSTRRH